MLILMYLFFDITLIIVFIIEDLFFIRSINRFRLNISDSESMNEMCQFKL